MIAILFKLIALVFCFNTLHIEMETFILQSFTLGLESFKQILHAHACTAQKFPSAFNNTLVKSQAICNRQCIATTRQTDTQSIGWRERFNVELDRSINHPWLFVRKSLQFGIMGCRNSRHMAFQQKGKNSASKGRTLARIGTRTQFIKQYQCSQATALSLMNQSFRHLTAYVGCLSL